MADRLGVRTSCEAVVRSSRHVRINDEAVTRLAHELKGTTAAPEWDASLHYRATGDDANERTAMWLLVLDTLNFCFWSDDPNHRWRVTWRGELVDGYVALVAALTTAVEAGYPIHNAEWLANVSERDVAAILAPARGHTEIPLFSARVANLRELGNALIPYGPTPATAFIQSAQGNAITMVQRVVEEIPSFNDVTTWPYAETWLPGNEVRLYKRAQILVGDLAGGLAGSALAIFADMDHLTAFADYKVPQILRWFGVLVYDDALAATVDTRTRIPAGTRMEIEIRAATIVACDRLVAALAAMDHRISATELDWLLWSRSQSLSGQRTPYHLTETIFY